MKKKPPDEGQAALWEVPARGSAARPSRTARTTATPPPPRPRPTVSPLVKRPAVPGEGMWGIEELSRFLGVPKYTIYGWRKTSYGPPAVKVGKHLRWRPEAVYAWLRSREDSA